MTSSTQKLFLMLVIGILIGAMGVLAWRTGEISGPAVGNDSTPSGVVAEQLDVATTSSQTISSTSKIPVALPEIPRNVRVGMNVSDQPAGDEVFVTGLVLEKDHWVAVYDEQGGQPGSILGASRVRAGQISTTVSLLRATEEGGRHYVAILNDNGDDRFDRQTDLPPLSSEHFVIVSFVAR
jgi:hypothetical protein